jgi:peptidoglycan/xylan/chitin deacetylase (PgdA/CDA1 family)
VTVAARDSYVPDQKGEIYYFSKHLAHRLQAARAWRASKADQQWANGVRILAYHRVCDAGRDELAVAPAVFRRQMEAVMDARVMPVPLDEALAALDGDSPGRRLCVTFDDAYHDNLEHAVPVLRELGIPATIFAPTAIVDGRAPMYWYRDRDQPPALSWDELEELDRDPLFCIGAHTRTHPALPSLSDDAAWDEIAGSKRDVEERVGRPVTSFAYPAGLYGERELRMVREAGYRTALTTEPGLNRSGQPRELLYRMFIDRRDTLRMFEAKIAGLLDRPWGYDDLRRLFPFARRVSTAIR